MWCVNWGPSYFKKYLVKIKETPCRFFHLKKIWLFKKLYVGTEFFQNSIGPPHFFGLSYVPERHQRFRKLGVLKFCLHA